MANISINPLTFSQRKLFIDGSNQPNTKEFSKLLNDLGQWANQIQSAIISPAILASVLTGNYALSQAERFVQAGASVAVNQTVDSARAPVVWLNYTWTGAATFTITLNNVVDGQVVLLMVTNSSGAARTVIFSANTVSSTAMSVVTGSNVISTPGVSVASATRVAFFGMASATTTNLLGVGQNW